MANSSVFCFYGAVRGLRHEVEIIKLWDLSWRRKGWNPVCLGIDEAKAHPLYQAVRNHVAGFYSRNPQEYDLMCWLRWLAFATAGGGLMTDYDVINRSLSVGFEAYSSPTILDRSRVPCCVSADAAGAETIVKTILTSRAPSPRDHFSDMLFFQASDFPCTKRCYEVGHLGWEAAECVHFSGNGTRVWNKAHGTTRTRKYDLIRQLMHL